MTEKPLVSVCIPTYNRAELLEESLRSLLCQPETADGRVEIVISDNASTDGTEALCRDLAARYGCVRYFRNEQNVRDRNFPLALSRGRGTLRKLSNDTLLHAPDSLALFCRCAEKWGDRRPVLFFQNDRCKHRQQRERETLDFNSFMRSEGYLVTWIGALAFWEDDCEGMEEDFDGCEKQLWQVQQLCRLLSAGREAVIVEERFASILEPPKKDISYGLYQIFYTNFFSILRPYAEKRLLTQECMEWIEENELMEFFPKWLLQWERQNKALIYSPTEDLKRCVFDAYRNKPYFPRFLLSYARLKLKARAADIKQRITKQKG